MPLVNRTFDQLIDFTRTSAATFVNSSGNIASTAQSRNLLTFTQEFSNAAWTKGDTSVSANTAVAPDGTSTADTLAETATTASHSVLQTVSSVSAAQHVFSVYLKKGTGATAPDWVQLTFGGASTGYVNFNLSTGAVGVASSATGAITSVGSGWYRCSVLVTIAGAGAASGQVVFTNNTDSVTRRPSYAGATTSDVFIWGAQLEQASSATDYTRNFGGLFPPRFDYDPVTRAPRGLLIEEQRTNLLVRSEEFDNAAWNKVRSAATANAATSPDGTADADKLTEDTSTNSHYAAQFSVNVTSGVAYTYSVFAKAAERSWVALRLEATNGAFNGGAANFNLSAGAVGTVDAGLTATISAVGSGWYRLTVTGTATATAAGVLSIYLASANNVLSYTGDGTSGIFVYGAQLEAGAFATSYIPTVASQVTRSADVAAINAPNFASWYNQSEGTFVAEVTLANTPATATFSLYAVSDNTANERVFVGTGAGSGGNINALVTDGGVIQAQTVNGSLSAAGTYKYANVYKLNDFASVVNGGADATDTSGTVPTVDRLYIGAGALGTAQLNGHIRSIRYYPTRLTNAQLQALTA